MCQLLREARIRGWAVNAEIIDDAGLIGIGDVVFREARLVIEVDGWRYHSRRDVFGHERARQNRLSLAKWEILRFTWNDLRTRPDWVINTVRVKLAQLGMPPSGRWPR